MYFNISVMKMYVVHKATDDTEQWVGLLLILLSHLVIFLSKMWLCFVGVKDGMSFICVYTLNTSYSRDSYCMSVTMLSSTVLIVV